jgi:hypothetical protein
MGHNKDMLSFFSLPIPIHNFPIYREERIHLHGVAAADGKKRKYIARLSVIWSQAFNRLLISEPLGRFGSYGSNGQAGWAKENWWSKSIRRR